MGYQVRVGEALTINGKYNDTHLRMNLGNKYNNEEIPEEEIEKKILNMIHSNLNAKILLNIGLFIFLAIFPFKSGEDVLFPILARIKVT